MPWSFYKSHLHHPTCSIWWKCVSIFRQTILWSCYIGVYKLWWAYTSLHVTPPPQESAISTSVMTSSPNGSHTFPTCIHLYLHDSPTTSYNTVEPASFSLTNTPLMTSSHSTLQLTPPPSPRPVATSTHPMITRAKARIFKPKHIADLAFLVGHPLHHTLLATK